MSVWHKARMIYPLAVLTLVIACKKDEPQSPVLVKIGKETLTLDDLKSNVPEGDISALTKAELDDYITQWINSRVLFQKAFERGMASSAEIKRRLHDYEVTLIGSAYLDSVMSGEIEIADSEIKKYYAENGDIFVRKKEAVHLRHLLFAEKKDADTESRLLRRNRVTFDSLITKYSPNKEGITNLGYVAESEILKKFWDNIKVTKVGSTTRPIESEFGFHIFEVVDRKGEGSKMDLTEVEEEIRTRKTQDKIEENYLALMSQLKSMVKIEINVDLLSGLASGSIKSNSSNQNLVLKK